MGFDVLRSLLENIKLCVPAWYAILGDEAADIDIANREQINLSIRWVNDNYEVSEDALWMFFTSKYHS